MSKMIQIFGAGIVMVTMTGCATPYMIDRQRDMADILTIGIDMGLGAKARVGPLQCGLLMDSPEGGLRGGQHYTVLQGPFPDLLDLQWFVGGAETFKRDPNGPNPERGKDFCAFGGDAYPFWHHLHYTTEQTDEKTPSPAPYYYTQIEVVGATLIGLRVGFNPGELLDFLLGCFGIDIFNDDLEAQKQRTKSNQPSQPIAEKPGSG